MNHKSDNERLGDISYFLNKIATELRIVRELLTQQDITISSDEFNNKFKEKQNYGK